MDSQDLLVTPDNRLSLDEIPVINLTHIENLTDGTGIIQHALYDMPNRKEGYCIDDNSRALLLMVLAARNPESQDITRRLMPVYLGFIHYMHNTTGSFRNFMCYDRTCQEEAGSEDSFGRTMMALGYLVSECKIPTLVKAGKELFERSVSYCDQLASIRGQANTIIGLCKFVVFNHPDDLRKELVIRLADKIVKEYDQNRKKDWHWYEPVLSYDNGILPLALLHAYELTRIEKYYIAAMESLRFLESIVFIDDMLRPIGNMGWYHRGGEPAKFDQQGIDAMAMVLCYRQALRINNDKRTFAKMVASYQWFLGNNDLGISLYDPVTGGCSDGLQEDNINQNQGAESTLAFWISHFVVVDILQS